MLLECIQIFEVQLQTLIGIPKDCKSEDELYEEMNDTCRQHGQLAPIPNPIHFVFFIDRSWKGPFHHIILQLKREQPDGIEECSN